MESSRPLPLPLPHLIGVMTATRHFVFLHVPRTGGSFIKATCLRNLPSEWFVPTSAHRHAPYSQVPSECKDLPMITFVRNPWDWYVSWYHWTTQIAVERRGGAMWKSAFDSGRASFGEAVARACTGRDFENRVTKPVMQERGVDHYTAIFDVIARQGLDEGRVEIGRYENLADDLLGFLDRHDVPIPPSFADAIHGSDRESSSVHLHYRDHYDSDLRQLVQASCPLVREFGYSF
jgi:hypothetical protein